MDYRTLSRFRSALMGFAMLWVMIFHAHNMGFSLHNAVLDEFFACGFGGVDIFILLSAMGLTMSLLAHRQEYGVYLRRRMSRILPAYYSVMLPFTVFSVFYFGVSASSLLWNSTLLYYWIGGNGAFNWYVGAIMLFYFLAPPYVAWLKERRHRNWITFSVVLLSLLLCQLLMYEDYWRYTDFFYRVPVFALGILLGFWVSEEKKIGWKDVLFWLFVFLLGAGYFYVFHHADAWGISRFVPSCHLFLFTTVPMCFLLCICFAKIPISPLWKALAFIGENSLEIYLLNVSWFSLGDLLMPLVGLQDHRKLYTLCALILNLGLGVCLHRVIETIKKSIYHKGESK